MKTSLLSTLLTASVFAAPAFGQNSVEVQCQLADGQATGCYYCPGYQYVIKFVGTQLQSTAVNLNLFQNGSCTLQGTWNGTVLTVTSAVASPDNFSIGGNGHIGNQFHFTTDGDNGDLALNLIAFDTTFLPVFGDQALQLDPASAAPLSAGLIGSNLQWKSDLDIPNNPALVGVRAFGQGFLLKPNGTIKLTNVDAKEVN